MVTGMRFVNELFDTLQTNSSRVLLPEFPVRLFFLGKLVKVPS